MKKALCLLTAMVLLLCACGSALAETGYLKIKNNLTDLLGAEPIENDSESPGTIPMNVCIMIDIPSTLIAILGENEKGEPVYSAWETDKDTLYGLFNAYCTLYDDLLTLLDDGWSLTLFLSISDETQIIVDNSALAAAWVYSVANLAE